MSENLAMAYKTIRKAVDEASQIYINTRPVVTAGGASFDLKDILILGAITGTDCLVTGKTGSGKTKLANLVMKGLFGSEYTNKTITPAMQPEDFLDIDFGIIKAGGTIQEAIKALSILKRPGVILNEANRAPGVIQNYLIPFLDKEMDIQGKGFYVGCKLSSGEMYQYRILTINEGEQYSVETMDKAIRDRTVMELPIDMFYQTFDDCMKMLDTQRRVDSLGGNKEGKDILEEIVKVYAGLRSLDVDKKIVLFLAYMSGMSYCIKINAPVKLKESIKFSSRICAGCHFAAETPVNRFNICGNVYAPSQRALINLLKVAKGIAYLRASKNGSGKVEVTVDDVLEGAPFVLHSKLGIDPKWVDKHYQGNTWQAITDVLKQVTTRYYSFLNALPKNFRDVTRDSIAKYAENYHDVWGYRLEDYIGK